MSISMSRPGLPPLSPMSMSSNDSNGMGRYNGSMGGGGGVGPGGPMGGTSNDVPYQGGPYQAARPMMQTSPPSSVHPSSGTDSSRPSGSSSFNRPPSSASSVGMMSSDGRRPPMMGNNRDSARSQMKPEGEEALQRHYATLKTYLQLHLQDEKGNIKPNRARDKLLRLSSTQFMELSTDVYDELLRREDERLGRVDNVPRFLLPKQNFHPKRNQARQKLSTLPIERFRQLATDVFFELERRIPRFVLDRPMSSASSGSRAPSRGGMRPPPPFGGGPNGRGPRMGPNGPMSPYYGPGSPVGPPGGRRPSEAGSLGRPLPKTFQSSTIVPNKSTMVEDDEDEEFGLRSPSEGAEEDRLKIEAQEAEIAELKERLESLESKGPSEDERSQWATLREELEQKAMDAQTLNVNLQKELAQLRQQMDSGGSPDHAARIAHMEDELARQEAVMAEVRQEATTYLSEMRELSRQNDAAVEQEERLAARVAQLEKENNQWRQRYAQVKAQNKSLRASTMGLGSMVGGFGGEDADTARLLRQEGILSPSGLVRDTDVTRFQLAVDELLRSARGHSTPAMLDSVKAVVVSVQGISSSVGTDGYPTPSPSPSGPDGQDSTAHPPVAKLQARVTGTANSLITATKQHAAAHGLAPVALLDAAASNLTAAVVQLLKAVRIRPSDPSELQHHDLAEPADELSALYEGDEDEEQHHASAASLGATATATPAPAAAAAKKPGNWFAWGKASPSPPPPSMMNEPPLRAPGTHHQHHASGASSGESDYEAYR